MRDLRGRELRVLHSGEALDHRDGLWAATEGESEGEQEPEVDERRHQKHETGVVREDPGEEHEQDDQGYAQDGPPLLARAAAEAQGEPRDEDAERDQTRSRGRSYG